MKLLLQVSQGAGHIQQDQIGNRRQQTHQPTAGPQPATALFRTATTAFCANRTTGEVQPEKRQQTNAACLAYDFAFCPGFEPFPFAIELNMHSMQVNLHCWAEQQSHLHQLREKLPTLRTKLHKAGFTCQQLDTRLGNPPPLKRQIQQYQVDIHT